ncbi:hypothetical protein E2320_022047 [Naja naja]|nr:hypothetical protein E2320_022047 [Naja naja]
MDGQTDDDGRRSDRQRWIDGWMDVDTVIDMGPQLKVVERTRTATMLCAASGNPDPEITWFKDFLPVDPSASNGRIKQLRSARNGLVVNPNSINKAAGLPSGGTGLTFVACKAAPIFIICFLIGPLIKEKL